MRSVRPVGRKLGYDREELVARGGDNEEPRFEKGGNWRSAGSGGVARPGRLCVGRLDDADRLVLGPARSDMPQPAWVAACAASTGPTRLRANSEVHNAVNTNALVPCNNCYITDMVANLVDSSSGTTVNLAQDIMLHHFVLIDPRQRRTSSVPRASRASSASASSRPATSAPTCTCRVRTATTTPTRRLRGG